MIQSLGCHTFLSTNETSSVITIAKIINSHFLSMRFLHLFSSGVQLKGSKGLAPMFFPALEATASLLFSASIDFLKFINTTEVTEQNNDKAIAKESLVPRSENR